jgi:hypothetical protein
MSSSEEQEPRQRGLPAVHAARDARASGKVRYPSVKFWGYSALILAVGAILQWKFSTNEEERARQKLMADQRAVTAELGPRWFPLREKIERWTTELAGEPGAEIVDREALKSWDFRDKAGNYLRLRLADAKTPESIRAGAVNSLRDGFTSCLMRVPNPNPTAGAECKRTRDCPSGDFCNEQDHCSRLAQPFNVRDAYRPMRVLSDDWIHEVQDASSDLRVRALEGGFKDTVRDDIPRAIEVLQKAQYLLVVLDEDVPGLALPGADAGPSAAAEAIQGVPHMARVGVWRLSDGKQILRLRREAHAQLLGATPAVDAAERTSSSTMQQANSCALALEVRSAMGDTSAGSVPAPAP